MNYPITTIERNLCKAITAHYYHEGWSNFLGGGSSCNLATAVLTIWEV